MLLGFHHMEVVTRDTLSSGETENVMATHVMRIGNKRAHAYPTQNSQG